MRIIQFTSTNLTTVSLIKAGCLHQINSWSRLRFLADDPEYITKPYDDSIFKPHPTIKGLYWINYELIYTHLGDDGRIIADGLIGTIEHPGVLLRTPLILTLPESVLEMVDVKSLVEAGYVAASEEKPN